MVKRTFDFSMAILGLTVTLPIFIIMSIWVKKDSPGPVFYRGLRVGKNGRLFKIFKFRSMVMDADKSGVSSTSLQDTRITPSGSFIRKWKLDELAQLINVIKGDMSLVGPRPEVKEFVDIYSDDEKQILNLRPGITDWASIWNSDEGGVLAGAADPDAVYLHVIRPIKIKLQLYYLESRTFVMDIKILFFTAYRVINSSFIPKEITTYPNFRELRSRALRAMNNNE